MPSKSFSRLIAGLLSGGVLVLTTGCAAIYPTNSPSPAPYSSGATITGNVHGGQQPIYNAAVRLYRAGTSGYGTGSTLLATTTTSTAGAYQFTKLGTTGGVISGGATATWQCPNTGDPQIYITVIGGNTQGTGVTTTNNAASGLMAAIGACSTISTASIVNINEITTVASVFALAQYINPGTTPGTETIGTSSSTQGTTGLNNAVASIANLCCSTGTVPIVSNSYTGVNSAAGATVTATPESAKLITIADILASCINQVNNAANNCVDLFANALPPPVASVTSQPTATFGTAQDTIQAAYYMAVNPIDAGTFTACNAGGTTTLGCLFLLASSNPPFQTALSTAPTDWTIGVTYTASGTCANAAPFILGPNKAGVDASGNIWFVSGASANANWGELSPTGTPLNCGGGNINGRGLSIDPTGNVWVSFNNTVLANSIQEVRADTGDVVNWTPTVTPYSIVSDGTGNIFSVNTANGGSLYEFAAPGTNYTATSPTLYISNIFAPTGTTNIGYIGADSQGRIFMTSSSIGTGGVGEVYSNSGTPARSVIATVPSNTNYGMALDSSSNVYSGTTCCSSGTATTFRNLVKTSPDNAGSGTSVDSTSYFAGNIGTRSVVLDGAGNQWFGNELPAVATPTTVYSVGEAAWNGTTPIALSTSGANPGSCATTGCPAGGGFQKADILESNDMEIDPSGNVWVMNTGTGSSIVYTGTTITEIVGAAVPVVTPLSVGAKNGTLASKP